MTEQTDNCLPPGWTKHPLPEVVGLNPTNPAVVPADGAVVSFVPMAAVTAITGEVDLAERREWAQVKKGYTRFQDGDVIFAKITPCMENGKTAVLRRLLGGVGAGSTEFHVLRPTSAIDADLLRYYVLQETFRKAARDNMTGTAGQLRVPVRFLEDHELPVPPLPEQNRIVASIEDYFSRLDEAVALLERVQRNLKRYRASVLKAAVEGRLVPTEADLARAEGRTYEPASVLLERILVERRRRWEQSGRKGKYQEPVAPDTTDLPELPEGWCWASTDQLVERPICYGVLKAGEHDPAGVPLVRVTDIVAANLSLEALKRCSPAREALFARARLKAGDLVVSKDGSIGFVAIVPPWLDGANITQHVLRVAIARDLSVPYSIVALRSSHCQSWMKGETRGVALQGVNVEDFRRMPVPLPPASEQACIAKEVERRISIVDAAERIERDNSARCARLRQSILKWAFEGRLADQDPTDEPAAVLLERIRAERSAAGTPRTARRGRPSRDGAGA